jgi:hypothetical protein
MNQMIFNKLINTSDFIKPFLQKETEGILRIYLSNQVNFASDILWYYFF